MTKLLVCITGMPGAGKSTITDALKLKNYEIINMGDAVRSEAKKRKIEPTGSNLGKLMLKLREQYGSSAITQLIEPQINNTDSNLIIIDGIRSNAEIQFLRKIGTVKILSIHASIDTRFRFLAKRGRSDDPQNKNKFEQRDANELQVGINTSIALADESISNNNLTIEQLINKAIIIIQNWIDNENSKH